MPSLRAILRKPATVVVGLMLLVLLAGALAVVFLDAPPVDDSDMAVDYEDIPEGDNGYTSLVELEDVSRGAAGDELEGLKAELRSFGWDQAAVGDFLGRHEQHLVLFERAAGARVIQAPAVPRFEDVISPGFGFLGAVRLRTEFHRSAGAFDRALRSLQSHLRVGRGLVGAKGFVMTILVGGAIEQTAHEDLRILAGGKGVGEIELIRCEGLLDGKRGKEWSRAEIADHLVVAMKAEYHFLSSMVDRIAAGELADGFLWSGYGGGFFPSFLAKPNMTRRDLLPVVRGVIDELSRVSRGETSSFGSIEAGAVFPEPWRTPWFLLSPNRTGRQVIMMAFPIFPGHANDIKASHRATRIHIALHRYRLRKATFPATLDDLVPEFLGAVPVDPYDGKPMRYDRDNELVWSVGPDGVDQGGGPPKPNLRFFEIDEEYEATQGIDPEDLVYPLWIEADTPAAGGDGNP